jgi:hypothetical protein
MPFSPISSLNSKKLSSEVSVDSDIRYMPPVIFPSLSRSERKLLFSDNLLAASSWSLFENAAVGWMIYRNTVLCGNIFQYHGHALATADAERG